jgi:hypothetical protein
MLTRPSAPEWATDPSEQVEDEDKTPVQLDRHLERCVPCLGSGQIRVTGRDEHRRRCTWCRGFGWVKVPSPGRRPR